MRFGIHFQLPCGAGQSPAARYRDTIEQAIAAEDMGFESVWPVEQHFDAAASILPAPLLLLASIAARTTTLRLGTGVLVLPLLHPVRVAEEIDTLDVLSGGRVDAGVGRGMDPGIFAGYGIDFAENAARLDEGLQILRTALSREQFSFDGAFHTIRRAAVTPRPLQRPHPPIRLAANSPETLERAGGLGLPIMVAAHVNPLPRLAEILPIYREARAMAGRPDGPDDVTVLAPVFTAESRDAVRRSVEPGLGWLRDTANGKIRQWRAAAPAGPAGDARRAQLDGFAARLTHFDFATMAESRAILDTPDGCIERLRELRDSLGAARVICWFNVGGLLPPDAVLRSMRLFSDEVIPALDDDRELITAFDGCAAAVRSSDQQH
jgi:alkanesulfonate monooxygenase SsuD/methylene tetrahydromethanopterin reductase-like flavin-dependent oxidoreductase (luciferase family)